MNTDKTTHLDTKESSHFIRNILYTTDLATDPDIALDYAITLALANEAKLSVLNCQESTEREIKPEELLQKEKDIDSLIGARVNPTDPLVLKWERVATRGNAAKEIVREAKLRNSDLVVMRSRRRPIAAAIFGSTTEAVCKTSPCPVLVIHPKENECINIVEKKMEINRILIAYDFSQNAKLALSYALLFANRTQAEVHLLYVLNPDLDISLTPIFGNSFTRALDRLSAEIPAEAVDRYKIRKVVTEGQPYKEILEYARNNSIDLISIGAHSENHVKESLFGTNADLIMRQAPCPILIAHSSQAIAFSASAD